MSKFKISLNCALCGVELKEDPPSLAQILRDCGSSSNPHQQAEIIINKHKRKPEEMFCERCFWLFEGVRPQKEKSEFWAMLSQNLAFLLVMVGIMSLCFGVAMFYQGYHSLDSAQDLERMALMLGGDPENYRLCYVDGFCDTFGNVYMAGVRMQNFGFILGVCSAFFLAVSLVVMIRIYRGVER